MLSTQTFFVNGTNLNYYFVDYLDRLKSVHVYSKELGPIEPNGGTQIIRFHDIRITQLLTRRRRVLLAYFFCEFCKKYYRNHTIPEASMRYADKGSCLKFIDTVRKPPPQNRKRNSFWDTEEIPFGFKDIEWNSDGYLQLRIVNNHPTYTVPANPSERNYYFGDLYCLGFDESEICIEKLQAKQLPCVNCFCRNIENLLIATVLS